MPPMPNSGYPVAPQNEYDRNHAAQRADRQQEINRFSDVSMDYLIARYSKKRLAYLIISGEGKQDAVLGARVNLGFIYCSRFGASAR